MLYRNYIIIFVFFILTNCTTNKVVNKNPTLMAENLFTNRGFTLKYDSKLYLDGVISNRLEERDLIIFQKNLKENTKVKITNLLNNRSIIADVGKKTNYPQFNNSVISSRIFNELDINFKEPYVEITAISDNSLFVAKKTKTFDEEKNVANKMPVSSISIDNLKPIKKKKNKKKSLNSFSYFIKIADFYFKDMAIIMLERIKTETKVKKPNIEKISSKRYRVYLGPFDNINSLQKSFNDISILEFDNIEIMRND